MIASSSSRGASRYAPTYTMTPTLNPHPIPPPRGRAIAYDTTFRFVIPAERRQAREPGPKNPCLGLISDAGILGSRIGSLPSPSGVTTRKAAKKTYSIAPPARGGAHAEDDANAP